MSDMAIENNEPDTLWEYIKFLRNKNKWSHEEFADKIGISVYHATSIEKDYKKVRRAASLKLVRTIAKVCAKNEKERKEIEYKLTLRRTNVFFEANAVAASLLGLKAESFIVTETMPTPFIERVKRDIDNLEDKSVTNRLSITQYALESMLAGKYYLSKRKVAEIAKRFKQPEHEYMLLAGYMPDSLHRIITKEGFEKFIEQSKNISDSNLEKLGITLSTIADLWITARAEKKEG